MGCEVSEGEASRGRSKPGGPVQHGESLLDREILCSISDNDDSEIGPEFIDKNAKHFKKVFADLFK